jgi:DNA polymerase III subunit beta
MKFIASSGTLLKHLQQAGSVISSNTVLPILEDFLLEIAKNKLTITATDLETVVKVSMEITSDDKGKICVPAKILLEALKNLPEQPINFNIESNFSIELTSDSGKYKIVGESADNYPKTPDTEEASVFSLSSDGLLTAINKTIYAVSTDDLRPAMMGVFFELDKKTGLRCVATDAHRLVRYDRTDATTKETGSFIVPRKPLNILKNLLPSSAENIEVHYSDKHFFVSIADTQLICRLIDARFPDYKVVIPQESPYTLTVNRTTFLGSLRRVSVFSNKSTNQVRLTITGSELQLVAEDVDFSFEGNERMSCQYDGEDMQIAFNARFLIEMLGSIDTDEVTLQLSTPNRAGILRPSEQGEGEDYLMLCMPLMVNV